MLLIAVLKYMFSKQAKSSASADANASRALLRPFGSLPEYET